MTYILRIRVAKWRCSGSTGEAITNRFDNFCMFIVNSVSKFNTEQKTSEMSYHELLHYCVNIKRELLWLVMWPSLRMSIKQLNSVTVEKWVEMKWRNCLGYFQYLAHYFWTCIVLKITRTTNGLQIQKHDNNKNQSWRLKVSQNAWPSNGRTIFSPRR